MGSLSKSINNRFKDLGTDPKANPDPKSFAGANGNNTHHGISKNKDLALNRMKKQEEKRLEIYGQSSAATIPKTSKFNIQDVDFSNTSNLPDDIKLNKLNEQINTIYREIQYFQENGLYSELKQAREILLKAEKIRLDEEFRQKENDNENKIEYDQLKEFVNKLLHFVVAWRCSHCNITDAASDLINELSANAKTKIISVATEETPEEVQ